MNVGDVVIPKNSDIAFVCGCGRYTHAIVVNIEPFILVSEQGDMMWSATIRPEDVIALCQASSKIVRTAMKRLNSEKKQRKNFLKETAENQEKFGKFKFRERLY